MTLSWLGDTRSSCVFISLYEMNLTYSKRPRVHTGDIISIHFYVINQKSGGMKKTFFVVHTSFRRGFLRLSANT